MEYILQRIQPLAKPAGFRDYAVHNILKLHRDFLKLEPVKPLRENSVQRELTKPLLKNPIQPTNPLQQLKVNSCQYHVNLKPTKPCIDCFLLNFFGSDLSSNPECAEVALQFKDSTFKIPSDFQNPTST